MKFDLKLCVVVKATPAEVADTFMEEPRSLNYALNSDQVASRFVIRQLKEKVTLSIEEVANRPGLLRIVQLCGVKSEVEARQKIKSLHNLITRIAYLERKRVQIGSLALIKDRAYQLAGEDVDEQVINEATDLEDSTKNQL